MNKFLEELKTSCSIGCIFKNAEGIMIEFDTTIGQIYEEGDMITIRGDNGIVITLNANERNMIRHDDGWIYKGGFYEINIVFY